MRYVWEHSTGYANTPRRSFPPLDSPHPRHPPRHLTPKGGKDALGWSCCCGPTLPCFVSLWHKTLPAMIKAIAVSGHNGLRHTLCKTVLPICFDSPRPPRQSGADCWLHPSRTPEAPGPHPTAFPSAPWGSPYKLENTFLMKANSNVISPHFLLYKHISIHPVTFIIFCKQTVYRNSAKQAQLSILIALYNHLTH